MVEIKIDGKRRIVRDRFIDFQTESDLECLYRNHQITINEQDTGGYYVRLQHPDGGYIIDGFFGTEHCLEQISSIDDCLKMCMRQILK